MVTAYVVTSGEYSAYQIHGVFTTSENAQTYIDFVTKNTDPLTVSTYDLDFEIEQYGLDSPQEQWTSIEVIVKKDLSATIHDRNVGRPRYGWAGWSGNNWRENGEFFFWVNTDNDERAIKVAIEQATQILAAGIWGDHDETIYFFNPEARPK